MDDPEGEVAVLLEPVIKLKESTKVLNVLDLGSGAGVLTRMLGKRFPKAEIFGIDFNERAIKKARAHNASPSNVTYIKASVTSVPKDWTQKFVFIVIYDVLHDLPCPSECIREVARVLKDDGIVSISDPKYTVTIEITLVTLVLPGWRMLSTPPFVCRVVCPQRALQETVLAVGTKTGKLS